MDNEKKDWSGFIKEKAIAVKNRVGDFADIATEKGDDAKKQLAVVADDLVNNAQKGVKIAADKFNGARITMHSALASGQ